MTDPVLLLDSTVLIAYERDLTRRAQAVVLEALAEGRLLATAALSLAVACAELGGETRELAWLVYDRDSPLSVLPLALGAMEVGAAAAGNGKTAGDLEVVQVIHEARAASAVVLTYDPDRYAGRRADVIDLRP
ncbi:MAG: hypothetical protein JO309_11640 [Pseudonocardiales bacterium]|nr:hypothetical protein [Pseudonocardiales bacterium]MBV9730034.1 hypothetical protein [Pseudonocardiales bacterium]